MACTSAPVSTSARVNEPSPAPISSTRSPGPTSARRAMRRTVLGSTTKFCPRARDGTGRALKQRGELGAGVGHQETLTTHDALPQRGQLGELGLGRGRPRGRRATPPVGDHAHDRPCPSRGRARGCACRSGRYHVAQCPGMYEYHVAVADPVANRLGLLLRLDRGRRHVEVVVVVVARRRGRRRPDSVVVRAPVGRRGGARVVGVGRVVVVGCSGLRRGSSTVVVPVFLAAAARCSDVVTTTLERQRTRVPARGDRRRTTTHLPVRLPGPRS